MSKAQKRPSGASRARRNRSGGNSPSTTSQTGVDAAAAEPVAQTEPPVGAATERPTGSGRAPAAEPAPDAPLPGQESGRVGEVHAAEAGADAREDPARAVGAALAPDGDDRAPGASDAAAKSAQNGAADAAAIDQPPVMAERAASSGDDDDDVHPARGRPLDDERRAQSASLADADAPRELGVLGRLAASLGLAERPPATPLAFDEGALDREALEDAHTTLEGVKMGDLLRCRIQYLAAQSRSLNQQAQFADAKAATLLTVIGLLIVNSPFAAEYRDTGDPVALAVLLLSGLCFGSCIYALVPRYPDPATRDKIAARDRFSWPGLASDRLDPEAYAQFLRDSQATHLLLSMARSNGALSKIILNKYKAIRFGFFCGVAAFFTFGFDFILAPPVAPG